MKECHVCRKEGKTKHLYAYKPDKIVLCAEHSRELFLKGERRFFTLIDPKQSNFKKIKNELSGAKTSLSGV